MATLVMLAGILFFLQRNWRSLRGRVWKSIVSLRCDWIGLDSGGRASLRRGDEGGDGECGFSTGDWESGEGYI